MLETKPWTTRGEKYIEGSDTHIVLAVIVEHDFLRAHSV